jgi:hypothetical protein
MKMQKLEILEQLKNKFHDMISPDLNSVKYCQTSTDAFVELYFNSNTLPQLVALDFYSADYEDGDEYKDENRLLFNPDEDIIDNAGRFIDLDGYSLIVGIDNLFTQKAIREIAG